MPMVSFLKFNYFSMLSVFILLGSYGCSADKPPPGEPAEAGAATEAGREAEREAQERRAEAKLEQSKSGEGALGEGRQITDVAPVYFEFDSATVASDYRDQIRRAADLLKEHPPVRIRLEGHADERGSADYNVVLGQRRAEAVAQILQAYGVPKARIETHSYGEEFPASTGHSPDAWRLNRRVEFVFKNTGD